MSDGEECFLTRPEWRQLLNPVSPTPAPPARTSFCLRSKLCDLLVDLPKLINAKSALFGADGNLLHPNMNLTSHYKSLLRQTLLNLSQLETLYNDELLPLLSNSISTVCLHRSSPELSKSSTPYPDILAAALDCILSSVLINLQDLATQLELSIQGQCQDVNITQFAPQKESRYKRCHASFAFVRAHSKLAAKPLEFGLRQIWGTKNQVCGLPKELSRGTPVTSTQNPQ
jgi:hypothetical protein